MAYETGREVSVASIGAAWLALVACGALGLAVYAALLIAVW